MAHSFLLKSICFAAALLYIASSCCEAQDAIQIVAKAALCFDNRPVINGCLTSMGITTNRTANTTSNSTTISPKQKNSTASFCNSPCYGQMILVANCMDVIMSNFQSYSPGLMQGVIAMFQMSCSGSNSSSNATVARVTNGGGSMMGAPNIGNVLVMPIFMCFWMPVLLASFLLI